MPVTAKLSRKFYETFGDEIANELVDWFNQVDATYRTDLRELNELNFARFEAKLEQRTAELEAKLEQRLAELRTEMRAGFADVRTALAAQRAEIIKWMFLFWAGTVATVTAIVTAIVH